MNPLRQYFVLFVLSISFLLLSCKENSTEGPSQFQVGKKYNITVQGIQYDEFRQVVPFRGPVSLSLITIDTTYRGTLSIADSTFTFYNISSLKYIVRAEKTGFYPYESSVYSSVIEFFPLLTPDTKIDSISISPGIGTRINDIRIRLVAAKPVPTPFKRRAVAFIGSAPDVGPQDGKHFGYVESYQYPESLSIIMHYPKSLLVSSTNKVYVTARFLTGTTKHFVDYTTGKSVYLNLEENSTVVIPYIFK